MPRRKRRNKHNRIVGSGWRCEVEVNCPTPARAEYLRLLGQESLVSTDEQVRRVVGDRDRRTEKS